MFFLRRPSDEKVRAFLERERAGAFSYPEVGATRGEPPAGYAEDRNRARLGAGREAFARAGAALGRWAMFELGWVEIAPRGAPIEPGTTVAVRARAGLWTLSAARIVYRIDEPRRTGFAYGTLAGHIERGEERFSVEWREEDDSVWYDIFAFSRPAHIFTKIGYPLARMMQKRFAKDSKRAMVEAMRR